MANQPAFISGNGSTIRTLAGLRRWSCSDNEPPGLIRIAAVNDVKHLHVYDFDNTLFSSPLPNRQLWAPQTIGMLQSQDVFINGGWWHDPGVLSRTGEGIEREEKTGWKGWWNEQIVELVRLTMQQKDALNVLLTGRSEKGFTELINRIAKSKGLEFDLICLKPEVGPSNQKFKSTMAYKQAFLDELISTYYNATEIKLYEDRPNHVKSFRDYFIAIRVSIAASTDLSKTRFNPRTKNIEGEVIEVTEKSTTLDPVTEAAEIQRMINVHNLKHRQGLTPRGSKPWIIERTIYFTGYMISPADTDRILQAFRFPPPDASDDWRSMANTIMITPRRAPATILDKVGGLGTVVRWSVSGVKIFENKIWAARVVPVISGTPFYTESPTPVVVLSVRGNGRPVDANRISSWDPLPPGVALEFDAQVGEKVQLRIEEERAPRGPANGVMNDADSRPAKRFRPSNDDFPPLGAASGTGQQNSRSLGARQNFNDDRRGSGRGAQSGGSFRARGAGQNRDSRGGRGNSGGGGQRGRGRGGYKSLDDAGRKRPVMGSDGAQDDNGMNY